MSERSTFVTETLAYFAPEERWIIANALLTHLADFQPVLLFSERNGTPYAVAGVALASYAGGEWEDFAALAPFSHDVSLVINCEAGAVIRFNLATGDFSVSEPKEKP